VQIWCLRPQYLNFIDSKADHSRRGHSLECWDSGTRAYDHSVRASEDISCPRPRGHFDRRYNLSKLLNSVALVRKRHLSTEQRPLVGEVNANFFVGRGCFVVSAQRIPTAVILEFYRPEPLTFQSSSASIVLHEAEWTPFQTPVLLRKSGRVGNRTRAIWI
jgi:hypothetical protein